MSWENWIEQSLDNELNTNSDLIDTVEILIKKYDLRSKNRQHEFIFRRYYLFYVLHRYGKMSYSAIGRFFGLNHATILHGLKRYYNEKDTRPFQFYTEDISKINWALKR